MRTMCKCLAGSLLWISASQASAGLVVTTYRTVASTNGFAPTSMTQYFAEQRLEDTTPAVAEVFGDWTGPNADGTPNTWHFVGTSRATSTTTITPESYTVEAAASFGYVIDTTAEFIDPRSTSVFGPGGTGQYRGFFQTDAPLSYSINALLHQFGRVRLNRTGGPEIFDEFNEDVTPQFLSLSGTIPPGQYQFLAASGLGLGNLSPGVNHVVRSGGFESLNLTVRVPEPELAGLGAVLSIRLVKRRQRS